MRNPVSSLADIRDKPVDPVFLIVILHRRYFQSTATFGACFKMLEGVSNADNFGIIHNRYEMPIPTSVPFESIPEIQSAKSRDFRPAFRT